MILYFYRKINKRKNKQVIDETKEARFKELYREKDIVVKSNDLIIQSRFDLSIQQQKILLYIISKINHKYDTEFRECIFDIKDFCDTCNITYSGNNYTDLKAQLKAISDKSIWITLPNGQETLLRWIEKPYIDVNSGYIRIRLDRDMKPYLLQLKQDFTKYELIFTLQFKSKYSLRAYEFIKARVYNTVFETIDEYDFVITIDEFKKRIGAKYNDFGQLKQWAIKPILKEINEKSDIDIRFEYIKTNKITDKIRIFVKEKFIPEKLKIKESYLYGEQQSIFDNF